MTETATYMKWLAILCAVMAVFGLAVFVIGYKDPSFGRVATVVALLVASGLLTWGSRRRMRVRASEGDDAAN